jgi:hypothetical protein
MSDRPSARRGARCAALLGLLAGCGLPACGDAEDDAATSVDGIGVGTGGQACRELERTVTLTGRLILPEGASGTPEGSFVESTSYRCRDDDEASGWTPGDLLAPLAVDENLRFEQTVTVRFIGVVVPEIVLVVCLEPDGDGVLWSEGDLGVVTALPAVDATLDVALEYGGCGLLL